VLSTLDSILNCKFYYIGMAIGLVKSVCKLGCISSNCVHLAELEEILPFIRACPPPYAPNWPKGEEEERMLELAGAIQYFFSFTRGMSSGKFQIIRLTLSIQTKAAMSGGTQLH